jgi:hypothetical protein
VTKQAAKSSEMCRVMSAPVGCRDIHRWMLFASRSEINSIRFHRRPRWAHMQMNAGRTLSVPH